MKNSKKLLTVLLATVLAISFFVRPTIAQEEPIAPSSEDTIETESTVTYEELDFDMDWDELFGDLEDNNSIDNLDDDDWFFLTNLLAGTVFGTLFTSTILVFVILLGLAQYIYLAVTLQKTAEKLGMKDTWYAWIPILNGILLFKMGDQNPYLLLLGLIPGIGALAIAIISIIATMKVCEKRGHDKMVGLLILIPLAKLILWGILAWGDNKKTTATTKK